GADLAEEQYPVANRTGARVAPERDRLALDVLHDQERVTVRRHPAIEKRGNVAVLEAGQDLTLPAEARQRQLRIEAAADQLDRHPLAVLVVGTDRFIDRAHPALPDEPHHLVRAE